MLLLLIKKQDEVFKNGLRSVAHKYQAFLQVARRISVAETLPTVWIVAGKLSILAIVIKATIHTCSFLPN